MVRRRVIAIVVAAVGLGSCAGDPAGPTTPLAREQVPPAPAFDAYQLPARASHACQTFCCTAPCAGD
jgi:hypothetical protein